MRTNEERIRLIHKRTEKLKKEKQRKKLQAAVAVCAAGCLVLITGFGLWIASGIDEAAAEPVYSSGAAGLLTIHGALGYILMGLLSFVLGVCVTILLYRLNRLNRRNTQHETPEDTGDEL